MKIGKKTIKVDNKREKVLDILKKAAQAWDVAPKGTIELKLLEKLTTDILAL